MGLLKYSLTLIIFISILGKFILIPFNQGLWWDEAVYLGLGENIINGFYSLDTNAPVETFRPPVFPLLIAAFSDSILFSRFVVVIISILSIVSVYFLSKEIFNKKIALWSAVFISVNELFIFFTTKVLTEPLFILFLSLSLLFFIKNNFRGCLLLSGFFSGLAFLTRYLGWILFFSYITYFFYLFMKRNVKLTNIGIFLIGFLIPLIPWFFIGCIYYGNPVGAFMMNFSVYLHSEVSNAFEFFIQIGKSLGFLGIFTIFGIYFFLKKKHVQNKILIILILFLPILTSVFLPHKEPRYMISFLPLYATMGGFFIEDLNKKRNLRHALYMTAILFSILTMCLGFFSIWNDRFAASSIKQGCIYLKDVTDPNEQIMSQSYPYIYYLCQRRTVLFSENQEMLKHNLKQKNIRYILYYEFEPRNPTYVKKYLSNNPGFKMIKRFYQWGNKNATIIYKFVE